MRKLILTALAVLGLGMAAAQAQPHPPASAAPQRGDQFNFMRGGGG